MGVGQEMADRSSTHKIEGVGLEVKNYDSFFGSVKYGNRNGTHSLARFSTDWKMSQEQCALCPQKGRVDYKISKDNQI